MPELFRNRGLKNSSTPDLDPKQRLLFLLTSCNICIDTAVELDFILNHRQDSTDTVIEITELIEKIRLNIKSVEDGPLKIEIEDICTRLEAECQQNKILNQENKMTQTFKR